MTTKQLLIVHLTDAHIVSANSIGSQRITGLASSIGSLIESDTEILLLLSGDVANSGKSEEYLVVSEAIGRLKSELSSRGVVATHVACTPGNHDCNFNAIPEGVRNALVASPDIDGPSPEPILDAISATLQNYRQFANLQWFDSGHDKNAIIKNGVLEVGGRKIRVTSLNSATTSVLHEKPATLRIPAKLLESISDEADVCIVIAHHPLNWFTPKDALLVSEWFDQTADIVLLGHEHRMDDFIQARKRTGSTVNYLVGLPLEDRDDPCGLRVIRLELSDLTSTEFEGRFDGSSATCKLHQVGSGVLCRNEGRDRGVLHFTRSHSQFLIDPGAGFTHPRVNRQVELDDIFVPAEFRPLESDRVAIEHVDASLSQSELMSSICSEEGRTLIFGGEQTGKTTFAKKLILEARSRRQYPIYLDAGDLRSLFKGEIRGWYNSAISRQFEDGCLHLVEQAASNERLIIVDNAQSLPGGSEAIETLVEFLDGKAKRVIVLTAENPAVSILSAQGKEEYKYWKSTKVAELLPLGHRRRGELIRKWVSLGRVYVDEAQDIEAEVRQVKKLLDRALGKSSLPKYPLFILVLLQQLEGLRANRTSVANGSHGYLFEALVSQAIDRHVRSHEIGAVTDFLSALARLVWERGGAPVSRAAIDEMFREFLAGLVDIDGERLLGELDSARVVVCEGGLYRFRYQYLYYYYLAKWANARADSIVGREFVERMVGLIHTELSSNVLMFLAHFGREQIVVNHVVPLVDSLFADKLPCELEKYSALSSRYSTAAQRAVLLQGPPQEVSDEHNTTLDRHEKQQDSDAEDSLKLNTTLKALQVLGQVLKSRATSMPPDQMLRVSEASMLAARRFMTFAYGVIEENAEVMVHGVSETFEKAFRLSKERAVQIANSLIGAMVLAVARIGIIRAADTMGAAELGPLIRALGAKFADPDSKLILLVARVIGDRQYPKEAVEDFVNRLAGGNVLPIGVLAAAVSQRFYLEPPERSTRESACELLGIDVKKLPPRQKKGPEYLDGPRRR